MANEPTFREVQRYKQPWLWAIISLASCLTAGLMAYGMIQQLVFHVPWGNHPMPDSMLVWFGPLMIGVGIGIFVLFLKARLITEVRGDGVYIRYIPFHRRFHWYFFDTIVKAEAVTYSPMRDYGGWGIRYGRLGKAYNVSGNRGVNITFTNGTKLLIGSMQPEALADAITRGLPFVNKNGR